MQRFQTPHQAAQWLQERVTGHLRTDNRNVQVNDGFIAWPGAAHDARRFVNSALEQGASACLVEESGAEAFAWNDVPHVDDRVASYSGLKSACGPLAASFYQNPSEKIDVIAITGTNGKTTVTSMTGAHFDNTETSIFIARKNCDRYADFIIERAFWSHCWTIGHQNM